MNYRKDEIIKILKEKTFGKLSDEQIEKIVNSLKGISVEEILVESDPHKFDGNTRDDVIHFDPSSVEMYYSTARTIIGDYISGKKEEYFLGDNFGDELYKNPKQFYDNRNEAVMDGILREIKSFEENAKYFGGIENMKNITTKDFVRNMIYNPKSEFYIDQSSIYPSLEKVLEIIHECGGLAFLAHLYVYSELVAENLDNIVQKYDLDGIETYYTIFSKEQIEYLKEYCKEHNLYKSGGSDFHGERKQQHDLGIGKGDLRVPKKIIEEWLYNA